MAAATAPTDDGWFTEEIATLGDRLAAAREAQGMGEADVAQRLGVRAKTVRQWEADASEPRANRLQMLAGLLGVSLRWLMTGEGEGVAAEPTRPDAEAMALIEELRAVRGGIERLSGRIERIEERLRKLGQAAA
ncbi:helix-turn-helix domain-containing protein [Frigidibacter sp. RF13]|uniref:helix-turn-helix domain-containing protein n=1 Tax=Frigidibacter sp. RF13 TaxID=2997340 RepID=UPI00226FB7C8|nr:helix-turn-helix domain-containing protein [Frigidibacter sp. RF13]MCY1128418.1 helix-turn-helix domain-containing protein [Frigidibacter sp. RF13]